MSRARISYNVQDLLIGNPLDKYEDPDYYGGYISKDNGLVAWYDFSDISTLRMSPYDGSGGTTAGHVLWGIDDKAGALVGSTNMAASSTDRSPTIDPQYKINNRTAAFFDGYNDVIQGTLNESFSDGHTIFVVAEPRWSDLGSGTTYTHGLIGIDHAGYASIAQRGIGINRGSSGYGTFGWFGQPDGSSSTRTFSTSPSHPHVANEPPLWKPHVYMHSWNNATNHTNTILTVDGLPASTTAGTPSYTSDSWHYVTIGQSTKFFHGLIGEILIFNRVLPSNERKSIENFLENKWGIKSLHVEDSSVYPFETLSPTPFGSHFEIPQRINRVQSFQYNFSQERQDLSILGKTHSLSRKAKSPTLIDGSFSYVIEGGQNEQKIGFNIKDQVSSNTSKINFIKNFLDESRYYDGRNIYVVSNKTNEDIREQHSNYPVNVTSLSQLHDVIDPNINRYSLLCLQDCYVNSYSLKLSVGDFPTTDIGFSACNATFYASGSGFCAPRFNKETNKEEQTNKQLIIPKHYEESSPELSHPLRTFSAGDLNLKINKLKNIYTSDFSTADGWGAIRGTLNYPISTSVGSALRLVGDGSENTHHAHRLNVFTIGKRYRVRGKVYVEPDPSSSVLGGVYLYNGTSNQIKSYDTLNAWFDFTEEFVATSTDLNFFARHTSGGTTVTMKASDSFSLVDIVVTELSDEGSPNFHSYPVESFDVDMTLNRDNGIHYLGNKRSSDMPIQFPIEINANVELIPSGTSSGSFESVFTNDDLYDISITAKKDGTGIQPDINLAYDLVGFNLDSVSESINVGSNNSLSLSLSTQIDTEDLTKGFFMSGTISELEHNLINSDGDTLTDSSSNPLVYSNHPLF